MMCRIHNIEQDNLTLDSFYLGTIHDTEDSTFWMKDVKVNNISVTFKVDTSRGNGSLRKYPTDFGSAGDQHARQETVWTKCPGLHLGGQAGAFAPLKTGWPQAMLYVLLLILFLKDS